MQRQQTDCKKRRFDQRRGIGLELEGQAEFIRLKTVLSSGAVDTGRLRPEQGVFEIIPVARETHRSIRGRAGQAEELRVPA